MGDNSLSLSCFSQSWVCENFLLSLPIKNECAEPFTFTLYKSPTLSQNELRIVYRFPIFRQQIISILQKQAIFCYYFLITFPLIYFSDCLRNVLNLYFIFLQGNVLNSNSFSRWPEQKKMCFFFVNSLKQIIRSSLLEYYLLPLFTSHVCVVQIYSFFSARSICENVSFLCNFGILRSISK